MLGQKSSVSGRMLLKLCLVHTTNQLSPYTRGAMGYPSEEPAGSQLQFPVWLGNEKPCMDIQRKIFTQFRKDTDTWQKAIRPTTWTWLSTSRRTGTPVMILGVFPTSPMIRSLIQTQLWSSWLAKLWLVSWPLWGRSGCCWSWSGCDYRTRSSYGQS